MTDKDTPPGKTSNPPSSPTTLRQQAEALFLERISDGTTPLKTHSPAELERMLHDLQVCQIELEMQNEELQRSQLEMDASRARYFDLYDLAPVGYLTVCEAGLIREGNFAAAGLLGVSRQALIKQPFTRFIPAQFQDPYYLLCKKLLDTRLPQTTELRMLGRKGKPFWAHLEISLAEDASGTPEFRVILTNIAERKRAEDARSDMEDFSTSVIHSMQDGFSVLDLDGMAVDVNPALCEMTGFSCDELVGVEPPHPYWPPEEFERIQLALSETMKSDIKQFELIFMRKNGERFPAIVSPFPVKNRNGETVNFAATVKDITERKQADDALRRSEEKYRKLHASMMDAFVRVDMNGRIIESNRAFREMVGYGDEELSRLTYVDLTPEKWHAMESAIVKEQILPTGASVLYEKEYRGKDGTVFPIELRTFLVCDAAGNPESMWAIIRDISRRKAAEAAMRDWNRDLEHRVGIRTQELLQSESRFRQLADATFEGIIVLENGIIVDSNPQLAAMAGCELKEMIGRKVTDFVAPESRALVSERIRQNSEEQYEFIALRKDGSKFPAMSRARTREWQGKLSRVTAIRDLTDIKRSQAKIARQQEQINKATRLALISEISAGIVHQIGQPLTALGVNLAVVSSRLRNCSLKECSASDLLLGIEADVAGMRDVIRRLRALAIPMPGNADRVAIRDVLRDAVMQMREEASNRGLVLIEKLPEELPDLRVDRVQMTQVIFNLLRNAIEATAHQSGNDRSITVAARPLDGNAVELTVCDQGTGMTPEVLESLFQPFSSTKPDGMGIGLRLSQTIIHGHGGTIEGFNNSGTPGATFRVILPPTTPP